VAPKEAPAVRKRRSKISPHARPHAKRVPSASGTPGVVARNVPPARPEPPVRGAQATPAAEPAQIPTNPVRPVVEAPAAGAETARPDPTIEALPAEPQAPEGGRRETRQGSVDPEVVETCFSLYQDRSYAEVISLGEAALAHVRTEAIAEEDAHDAAALWSVVALAKQARQDDEGARAALESALEIAPPVERPTYRQHLAALSLNAAQTLLERAASQQSEDRVSELRAALVWIERGLSMEPADGRLNEAGRRAQEALWPAYEQTVNNLLQRQEFETARRLLHEALADARLPSHWVGDFQNLLSGTFGGEIGQLTAQAIRSMQEERESEALAALQRAEELLATSADEALPLKRREEVDQRLWWGYTRLGVRRVESGQYEEAIDPLVHALRFATISPDRQAETRATLARALEGVADVRALGIRQLNDDGNRDEAVLKTQALRELLRSCMERGLSEDELSVAFTKTERLARELGMGDRA
jgi:tetratricopeptide (TPR) repeat protein